MRRPKLVTLAITGTLALNPNFAMAEVLIVEPLNLRQSEIDAIADLSIERLGEQRPILTVRAYKFRRGSKEALVTFEPKNLRESSFSAESVQCQKLRRRWTCQEPQNTQYYYDCLLYTSDAADE